MTAPPVPPRVSRQSTYRGHPALLCEDCGLPFIYAAAGALIIHTHHKGVTHKNFLSLAEARALLDADGSTGVE